MNRKWIWEYWIYVTLFILVVCVGWTYRSVELKNQEEDSKKFTIQITPEYNIVSRRDVSVWPAGSQFEQGMAAYFYAVNPEVIVVPKLEVLGAQEGSVYGTEQSRIIVQVVNDKSQVYWSYEVDKMPVNKFTIDNYENKWLVNTTHINLNILDLYEFVIRIGEEISFAGGVVQALIISEYNMEGIVNGETIIKRVEQVLPIDLQTVSFTIPKAKDISTSINIENSMNPVKQNIFLFIYRTNPISSCLVLLFSIVLLVQLWILLRKRVTTDTEHRRFREWITEGSVDVKNHLPIQILSLEGLVDLAIDLDKRVIHDSKVSKYYVIAEDIIYIYDIQSVTLKEDDKQKLGKLLIEQGVITAEQLEVGIHYEKKIGKRLGESLMALGFIDETTLYSALAAQQKMDYIELESRSYQYDEGWFELMTLNKAKALMSIPLGKRADGKLVIAISETSNEGVKEALHEMYGNDIVLVAANPSVIHEIIERLEEQRIQIRHGETLSSQPIMEPFERLLEEEREEFEEAYYRGTVKYGLLLKAAGIIDSITLATNPEKESATPNWFVSKHIISSEFANLLRSLDKMAKNMDWEDKMQKKLPELIELLVNANYLTSDTMDWISQELVLQKLPLNQMLIKNYIVSEETVRNAEFIIKVLKSLLEGRF